MTKGGWFSVASVPTPTHGSRAPVTSRRGKSGHLRLHISSSSLSSPWLPTPTSLSTMRPPTLSLLLAALAFLALLPSPLFAITVKNLVVLGDSYSDPGNRQRMTNGPLWAEDLAHAWGAQLHDFAFSGATCQKWVSQYMQPSVKDQLTIYYNAKPELHPDETVYAIWIGINDITLVAAGTKYENNAATKSAIVDCVKEQIQTLRTVFHAKYVLILNVPPIELSPLFFNNANLKSLITEYNTLLGEAIPAFIQTEPTVVGLDATVVNIYALFGDIIADPATYGFDDVQSSYWDLCTGTCDKKVDEFLWWDQLHLTGGAHRAVANVIIRLAPFGANGDLITETSDVKVRSPKYAAAFATSELIPLPVLDPLDVTTGDKPDHSTDDILDSDPVDTTPEEVEIITPDPDDVETTPDPGNVEIITPEDEEIKDVETTTPEDEEIKDVETTTPEGAETTTDDPLDSLPSAHSETPGTGTEIGIQDPIAVPASQPGAIMMSLTVASIACIGVFAYFFYRKKGGFSGGRGKFTAVPMNELENGRV